MSPPVFSQRDEWHAAAEVHGLKGSWRRREYKVCFQPVDPDYKPAGRPDDPRDYYDTIKEPMDVEQVSDDE